MPRRYEMRRRADGVAETRRRIVEAAVELHGTLGPARTTISAIAERAGVERVTVYRHFPDEVALFRACTSHWSARHPAPDPAGWAVVDDPAARLRRALGELYAWYRSAEPMLSLFVRDAPLVPALAGRLAEREAYVEAARAVLLRGWHPAPAARPRLAAALGLALSFEGWRTLAHEGLHDTAAVELMACLVRAAAAAAPCDGGEPSVESRVQAG